MKLVLGVANFDSSYGLINKLKKKSISLILNKVKKKGINEIDTAINYRKSNQIISKLNIESFKINTKLPLIKYSKNFKNNILNEINRFKINLNIKKINILMFHDRKQIYQKNFKYILDFVKFLKKKKIINGYGFSVYNEDELFKISELCNPDVIQIPLNLFDQRFKNNKIIKIAKIKKIKLHARSVFLQGLLLNRSLKFNNNKSKKILKNYWDFILDSKYDALQFNINFLLKQKFIDKFIVSFDNIEQIKRFYWCLKKKSSFRKINYDLLSQNYKKLILPYLWKKF